jgi:hypothetical protein
MRLETNSNSSPVTGSKQGQRRIHRARIQTGPKENSQGEDPNRAKENSSLIGRFLVQPTSFILANFGEKVITNLVS